MPRSLLLGGLAAAVIAVSVLAWSPAPPTPPAAPAKPVEPPAVRPTRPPGPGDPRPSRPAEPRMPTPSAEWKAALADKVQGTAHPGETAFRELSDLYVDENMDFARRQAELEKLTLPEVRELTYFGMLVMATQRVPDVEEMLGRGLTAEEREALAGLVQGANEEFKREMRALVARGAGEDERWNLIRNAEARYRKDFYATTGMNDELLDDLLAGNILLPGAPARGGEPPAGTAPGAPKDQPETRPRPGSP